jgi:hypothetical protein
MGNMMHTLHEDQQRMERRSKPAPVVPASRADQIIAEGERRRVAYRQMNLNADTAMTFGAQIGYLHGEIQRLDAELQGYSATRDKNLGYATVYCNELDCDVLVGYDYSAGEDSRTYGPPEDCHEGSPESLEICEVWLNGADIAAVLLERVAEQLTEAALEHERESQQSAMDDFRERQRDYMEPM